jgi:glutamate dehydrogenase (NAD(P)+)
MREWTKLTDDLGPMKILHVYDPVTKMKGVVVIDTVALGGAAGGTRMLPDINTEEIAGLARAMSYKFTTLDIPVGGAKSGIWADPSIRGASRRDLMLAFGRAIKPLLAEGLVAGADMGTYTEDLTVIHEGAGIPARFSGLSLEKIDGEALEDHATGYGVVVTAKAACEFAGINLKGAKVAIEGFGKVGGGVARYMTEEGARVVAISTVNGMIYNEKGLDIKFLLEARLKQGDKAIQEYKNAKHLKSEEMYALPVDILIPGARPYVIDKNNVNKVQAKIISSIANIPITDEAEEMLAKKGIYSVPDFISNAGGVLLGVVDILGGKSEDVFRGLREVLAPLTKEILTESKKEGGSPRGLAVKKATAKILKARSGKVTAQSFEGFLKIARQRLKM